jgi:hypothetical protein
VLVELGKLASRSGREASGRCLVQGKLEVLVKLIAAWGLSCSQVAESLANL